LWLAISHVFSRFGKKNLESLYSVKSSHGTDQKKDEKRTVGSLQVETTVKMEVS